MECLDPPLQEVPVDEWFCPECAVPGVDPTHGNVLSFPAEHLGFREGPWRKSRLAMWGELSSGRGLSLNSLVRAGGVKPLEAMKGGQFGAFSS